MSDLRQTDEFPGLLAAVRERLKQAPAGAVFLTKATDLWGTFTREMPADLRAHYDCRACRHFVERFGSMVTIGDDGAASTALWPDNAPSGFAAAFRRMAEQAERAEIECVLMASERTLGTPQSLPTATGHVWTHFAVDTPPGALWTGRVGSAFQAQAERAEGRRMLLRALSEFPQELVARAHALLTSGALYRSEKCVAIAEWLLTLHRTLDSVKAPARRDALVWRAAATAPAGFAHVRSGMIGTLLEDLQAGLDADAVKRRFDEKMAPDRYMRAQAAPAAGAVATAERLVADLKVGPSLRRRYARLSDVQRFIWRPSPDDVAGRRVAVRYTIFKDVAVKTRPEAPTPPRLEVPRQTMTWVKFANSVLPDAQSVEVQVPETAERFAALVTSVAPEDPPVLQWDSHEERNPVSWYYHSGIDAEMKRRVEGAGGKHEGTIIRATLMWNNRNDLDLHARTPSGQHIYFGDKRASCGGYLDVDMNVGGETTKPVENIRWANARPPRGRYHFQVHHYRAHENRRPPTPFTVELEVGGRAYKYEGPNATEYSSHDVFALDYATDLSTVYSYAVGGRLEPATPVSGAPSSWGLVPGAWARVTGVVASPNLWSETRASPQHGRHTFFLLEGCRDASSGMGRGLFTETLLGELRPARATIEAFMAQTAIEGADAAEACGLGMSSDSPWGLTVRVKTDVAVATYLIDRWD